MSFITDLSELKEGDEVYLYGSPFTRFAQDNNPFVVYKLTPDEARFTSKRLALLQQSTTRLFPDSFITRGPPTPADLLVLQLEGVFSSRDY